MSAFVDPIAMQHRLFAELSRMFGEEVPLYDTSLLVNHVCNRAVCTMLGHLHRGFELTDEQLERGGGERHGAIRIGRPDEFRWIARFFAQFGMEPHNFFDMTDVGAKSQPIIATAFRSMVNPEHRVFASLLQTNYFDPGTRARIESRLATRDVFSARAKELIERGEADGGLGEDDAAALIAEATERIFRWTGRAHDHQLYLDLCQGGFKIAADIACFERHHLNHLTPNTFCMDLYTAAMKHAMGEQTDEDFREAATWALESLSGRATRDWMVLHFKHLDPETIDAFPAGELPAGAIDAIVDGLIARFTEPDLDFSKLTHNGFKDHTEGPAAGTQILLRQDAYNALTEPVVFTEDDGRTIETVHTARFGEIEQRFYATTAKGRAIYDAHLAEADAVSTANPGLQKTDPEAYEALYAAPFAAFKGALPDLLAQGLVYGRPRPTPTGRAAADAGSITTTDLAELAALGFVRLDGIRYEDFLPVSAAGIFASNLQQYGTTSTAAEKPVYEQSMLEDIMGRPILDSMVIARGQEAEATLATYAALGLLDRVPADERRELEAAVAASPATGDQPRSRTHVGAGV
jgi:uncharacterized glyoxalase superfamily metalloenzyme YdcJ